MNTTGVFVLPAKIPIDVHLKIEAVLDRKPGAVLLNMRRSYALFGSKTKGERMFKSLVDGLVSQGLMVVISEYVPLMREDALRLLGDEYKELSLEDIASIESPEIIGRYGDLD